MAFSRSLIYTTKRRVNKLFFFEPIDCDYILSQVDGLSKTMMLARGELCVQSLVSQRAIETFSLARNQNQ